MEAINLSQDVVSSALNGWRTLIAKIAAPVLAAAKRPEGLAQSMPVEVAPGARDRRQFSALETIGRLLCGLAPLLEREWRDASPPTVDLADVHALIAVSVDPVSVHRLNFSEGLQPLVDAAFLAQAVLRAPGALWAALPSDTQRNLLQALRQTRRIDPYYNNWLLFSATIETMFASVGEEWDAVRIDYALRQHEAWYVGDGMYRDGPHFHWDYYNAYVIHSMLRDILICVGDRRPDWLAMQARHVDRTRRYAVILERSIGADGSFPPIGRSLAYRCAAFQPLAHLAWHDDLPAGLQPGQVRCALDAVISRTLGAAENFDADGWLKLGLNGSQPDMAERYVSTGSLYLCSTAFLPLGLPSNALFWTDPPASWSQRKLWGEGHSIGIDRAFDT